MKDIYRKPITTQGITGQKSKWLGYVLRMQQNRVQSTISETGRTKKKKRKKKKENKQPKAVQMDLIGAKIWKRVGWRKIAKTL